MDLTPSVGVIDHLAYPQIIDSIFERAPYESLLALRGASAAFLHRTDSILSTHLKITVTDTRSALGAVPAFSTLLPLSAPRFDHATQVIDFFDIFDLPIFKVSHATPAYPPNSWRILRFRLRNDSVTLIDELRPKSLIVFGQILDLHDSAVRILSVLDRLNPPPDDAVHQLAKITLVLYSQRWVSRSVLSLIPNVEELVVIFKLARENFEPFDFQMEVQLVFSRVLAAIQSSRNIQVTLVNASSIPHDVLYPQTFRLRRSECDVDIGCATVDDYVEAMRRSPRFPDHVRSLTLEEYECQVGSHRFKLETDPSYVMR
ncbi:hypothetical protein CspHIS471_0302670 [Cutaneotrichosporon sp. HIS471]|nr:hypothetical protein CspHIS471_0302670 [Cutaneotrichosporon sp. HIS471]